MKCIRIYVNKGSKSFVSEFDQLSLIELAVTAQLLDSFHRFTSLTDFYSIKNILSKIKILPLLISTHSAIWSMIVDTETTLHIGINTLNSRLPSLCFFASNGFRQEQVFFSIDQGSHDSGHALFLSKGPPNLTFKIILPS